MKINVTIVGGCFTEQHNIAFEDLYHQIVKREIEKNFECTLQISIIRYERITKCLGKIEKFCESNPVDILIFHIRSEQFLRLSKLYYKYSDDNGVTRHSLNLPLLSISNPEKYKLHTRIWHTVPGDDCEVNSRKVSIFRKTLVEMNYAAGILAGNSFSSKKKYLNLIREVFELCSKNSIEFILAGPASRPHSRFEDYLTGRLHYYTEDAVDTKKVRLINCLGILSENKESLFFENGIHVSKSGHKRIAGLIINEVTGILNSRKIPLSDLA